MSDPSPANPNGSTTRNGSAPRPRTADVHRNMLARIPSVTGREIGDWLKAVDDGPALLRVDEKVTYLKDTHNLSHGYAKAIVHEHELRRAARRLH